MNQGLRRLRRVVRGAALARLGLLSLGLLLVLVRALPELSETALAAAPAVLWPVLTLAGAAALWRDQRLPAALGGALGLAGVALTAKAYTSGSAPLLVSAQLAYLTPVLYAGSAFVLRLAARRFIPRVNAWSALGVALYPVASLVLFGGLIFNELRPVPTPAVTALSLLAVAVCDALVYLPLVKALLPGWAERSLREATLPLGVELLEDQVPVRVRLRVPCKVPYGLRVTSLEEGVPFGNPILDHLLGLATVSPADSARLLSANEDTVLGLLHRFPESHLEPDAVVFEATAEQLVCEGGTQRALEEGVAAAEALAVLFRRSEAEEAGASAPERPPAGGIGT